MEEESDDGVEPQQQQQEDGFERCNEKHNFCPAGLGECTLRKDHKGWGQDHVCNKCDGTW